MNVRNFNDKPPALLAAIALAVATANAQAQLEEVIVTAQKRAESLQDVPVTLQAFSGDVLTDFGITDTQSLQIVTPGLVVNNSGTSAQVYLRGVGTRFAFAGLDPSVATYVDDRYIGRAQASIFEFADVERIEVLKGPQGTLYGRNATGGAIRVVTLDVDDDLNGKFTATAGNYNHWAFSGTVNIPLTDDLGVRLSGLVKQRDGYADNLDPRGASELDDQDYQAYKAKFRWDMSDIWTARLSLEYTNRNDLDGSDQVDISPPGLNRAVAAGGVSGKDVDEVYTATFQKVDSEQYAVALRLDGSFEKFDFASITTYWDFDNVGSVDADGTSRRDSDASRVPQKAESFSQELQWLSNSDGDWNWIAGLYYFRENNRLFELEVGLQALLNTETTFTQGNQSSITTAYAGFGQLTYDINEAWSLTLGGRYSSEKKEVAVQEPNSPGVISLVPYPFEDEEDWAEFTPKATLEYAFEQGMVYLSYARGFKSGGFNYPSSTPNPLTQEDQTALEPEILDMVELGWKTELFDRRLRLNGAVFYYDYQDLQVTRGVADDNGAVLNVTENAANAKIKGLDLDITWLPVDNLTLTAGLNLLDSEYQDFDASANIFRNVVTPGQPGMMVVAYDADGESLLRAPDWSAIVSASYEFSAGGARIPVVLTYSHKDEYNYDFVGHSSSSALIQDSYGLLSARATYVSPSQSWQLAVWGKNLTDEDEYYDDIVGNAAGIRGSYGTPRTYGVDFMYFF
ncbi:MAG: TonB-dependent receptor [Parahaliea sp.]